MPIDFSKLRSLTIRKLLSALKHDGFIVRKSRGATQIWIHPDGRIVTLHVHNLGQTLKIGTLQEIIENEAQWTEEDLKRLKLVK
jgi:predicted RNA binding protein YcfA (HicA-like mRNA interferase family)